MSVCVIFNVSVFVIVTDKNQTQIEKKTMTKKTVTKTDKQWQKDTLNRNTKWQKRDTQTQKTDTLNIK